MNVANPDTDLDGKWLLTRDKAAQPLTGGILVTGNISSPADSTGDVRIGHIWRKTTEISDTNVKALPTTPIEIIPAPGANMLAILIAAYIRHEYTANYTNIDAAGAIYVRRGATDIVSGSILNNAGASITDLNIFLTGSKVATLQQLMTINTTLGNLPKLFTYAANESHVLVAANGGSGNFTGGNAANELIITALYHIIDYTSL